MTRPARYAGSWYPADPETLRSAVEGYIAAGGPAAPALGLMVPHAGYIYSGRVAGIGYAAVEVPASVVVLAPKHHHAGPPVSVWDGGGWQTPLGEVPIDEALRDAVLADCGEAVGDRLAHSNEHSLELQLPFLKVRRPDLRIVPIAVGTRDAEALRALGEACAKAIGQSAEGGVGLVVASSDMSHYVSAAEAKEKDSLALERLIALDPEGLLDVVEREGISMCGVAPAAAMLFAARALGAGAAEVVAYATSGDVTGDRDEVVGYAAAAVRP